MPFTPFHMGPGLAIKGLLGNNFSLITFGFAQVAIDIEPLIGLIRGSERLHSVTHTYFAAFIIALILIYLAPIICSPLIRRWNQELTIYHLNWLIVPEELTRISIISGAIFGTFSHIALDSLTHFDMAPLAPWSNTNSLLDLISRVQLENWCIVAGISGIILWLAVNWLRHFVLNR